MMSKAYLVALDIRLDFGFALGACKLNIAAMALAGLMLADSAGAQTVSCVSDTETPVPILSIPVVKSTIPMPTSAIPASTLPMPPLPISLLPTKGASDPCITEFALPPGVSPGAMAFGPDGNIWFTASNGIDRMLPHSPYTLTNFPVSSSIGLVRITPGPDGNMWFTAYTGQIGRILTKYPNTITLFTIPGGGDGQEIVAGPDGALWFTEYGANRIGRIWPFAPNKLEQFPVPTTVAPDFGTTSGPTGITVGPDGNIWFIEQTGGKVGRITLDQRHEITEFPVTTTNTDSLQVANGGLAGLYGIASGPDGALWFTETNGNSIGRIEAFGNHKITQFPLEDPSQTIGITTGPDGDIWFNVNGPDYRTNAGAAIGHIKSKPPYTIFEYYDIHAFGFSIVPGLPGDYRVWFTESRGGGWIGRLEVPCERPNGCGHWQSAGR
jgi:streptogramin lyase